MSLTGFYLIWKLEPIPSNLSSISITLMDWGYGRALGDQVGPHPHWFPTYIYPIAMDYPIGIP